MRRWPCIVRESCRRSPTRRGHFLRSDSAYEWRAGCLGKGPLRRCAEGSSGPAAAVACLTRRRLRRRPAPAAAVAFGLLDAVGGALCDQMAAAARAVATSGAGAWCGSQILRQPWLPRSAYLVFAQHRADVAHRLGNGGILLCKALPLPWRALRRRPRPSTVGGPSRNKRR